MLPREEYEIPSYGVDEAKSPDTHLRGAYQTKVVQTFCANKDHTEKC